jgi:alpha-ribazole phosphatase
MRNIYLVRHGEALDDINNTFGGWADDPLTEQGIEMANELAKKVRKLGAKKIYTSPLLRAKVTAEIVGKHLNLEVEVIENLKERNRYGFLTGINKDLARQKYPELVEFIKDQKNTMEGAESYEDYKKRIFEILGKIISEASEDVLIVCHQGIFRQVMWEKLNRPDYLEADHHAIIHIQENKGKLKLKNTEGIKFQSE